MFLAGFLLNLHSADSWISLPHQNELSTLFRELALQAKKLGIIDGSNVYDGIQALPLIENQKQHYEGTFLPQYYIIDSGYDFEDTYRSIIKEHKGSPIIAYNPRGSKAPPEGMNSQFQPICSASYAMTYHGVNGDFVKFRCPLVTGHCDYPFGSNWCSSSNYGYTVKVN